MLINVELKTCSKYIHANEITITASNNVLDTSLLSEKGKRLFVEIFKDNYFATVPTVAYQAFIEAQNEEPIDPVEPDPEEPVEVPATYSIFKSGNTLTDKAVTTTDDTEITVTVTKETADEVTVTKGSFDSV